MITLLVARAHGLGPADVARWAAAAVFLAYLAQLEQHREDARVADLRALTAATRHAMAVHQPSALEDERSRLLAFWTPLPTAAEARDVAPEILAQMEAALAGADFGGARPA